MIKFLSPIDGDVLFTNTDGILVDGRLKVKISLSEKPGLTIKINQNKAIYNDGIYSSEIYLDSYCNQVTATCEETLEISYIKIYWFAGKEHSYCLGVDDVIYCFKNIYEHQNEYNSLFDDPFLAVYKDLYDKYKTKVHMHIYYETPDKTFNLSMFPVKFKSEFKENSNWLRFTFHSRCDIPASPYKNASYDLVFYEGKQVENEIKRFAGSEVMDSFTSQHWADSSIYGTRAFRDLGYKILDAYFLLDKNDQPYVSYYLNKEQALHAHDRDFWVDTKENIIFVRDDIIINEVKLDEIDNYIENLEKEKCHSLMYLLIHEQYFYKFYSHYEPDYRERIFKAVEFCNRKGYRSVFVSDMASEK